MPSYTDDQRKQLDSVVTTPVTVKASAENASTVAAGLVLLVRRVRDPDHPVRQSVAAAVGATRDRLGALLGPVPEADAAATVAALLEPEPEPEPEPEAPRAPFMPSPRLPSRSGGTLPADDQVFHRTQVRVYETAEEREDGGAECGAAQVVGVDDFEDV